MTLFKRRSKVREDENGYESAAEFVPKIKALQNQALTTTCWANQAERSGLLLRSGLQAELLRSGELRQVIETMKQGHSVPMLHIDSEN